MVKYQTQRLIKILRDAPTEYYLPPIQRTFVWEEERIQKLFDSILRNYPISTFLFWKTKERLKLRKFIQNYQDGIDLDLFRIPADDSKKMLILDGQQRLQSLYVGAEGSFNGRELYFDPLSGGSVNAETGEKYIFRFLAASGAKNGWVKLKDVLHQEPRSNVIRNFMIQTVTNSGKLLTKQDEDQIDANASAILERFMIDEALAYYEIDGIDGQIKDPEEVYEIFVRANSGGVPLTKSDLVFSTIVLEWPDADSNIERLVRDLNMGGKFSFDNDFVIKSCLTFVGAGARYEIKKLRGPTGGQNLKTIQKNWPTISQSLKSAVDFVSSNGIPSDDFLYSKNALIPIAYHAFVNGGKLRYNDYHNTFAWLCRALLNRDFSGQSDTVIDNCKSTIEASHVSFPFKQLDVAIPTSKKTGIPPTLSEWKGGESLILNLVYRHLGGVNFQPLVGWNAPELDHIFPQSKLKQMQIEKSMINTIGNLRYVSDKENRDKTDTEPNNWFPNLNDAAQLSVHLIPSDQSLWVMARYKDFVFEREQKIFDAVSSILQYK